MSDERFADQLDPENTAPAGSAARVRGYLSGSGMWAEPEPDMADRLVGLIGERAEEAAREQSSDTGSLRPLLLRPAAMWIGAAAVVALIALGAITLNATRSDDPVGIDIVLQGTELAAGASADGSVITTDAGFAIRLEITGLPPAPAGTFYQGWVRGEAGSVAIGTFHMRGNAPIGLWSGVEVSDYPTLNITLQDEGAGPESSGKIVLTGQIPSG